MSDAIKINHSATLSECGLYRFTLERSWASDLKKPWLGWIMLNPSTADASVDDPTIRRCMGFATDWGFGGIAVRNLFNLRTKDPLDLLKSAAPIAPAVRVVPNGDRGVGIAPHPRDAAAPRSHAGDLHGSTSSPALPRDQQRRPAASSPLRAV
jgi:hypothetical protein